MYVSQPKYFETLSIKQYIPYVDHTCIMFLQNTYMCYACQNTLVIASGLNHEALRSPS